MWLYLYKPGLGFIHVTLQRSLVDARGSDFQSELREYA
jgi:hypothetical protein